jgi:hypothetical protein
MTNDNRRDHLLSIAAFLPIEDLFDADSGDLPFEKRAMSDERREALARRIDGYLDDYLPIPEIPTQKGTRMTQEPETSLQPSKPLERFVRDGVTMLRLTAREGLARLAELLAPEAQTAFRDGRASPERLDDFNRLEGFDWLPEPELEEYDGGTTIDLRTPIGVKKPEAAPDVMVTVNGRVTDFDMNSYDPAYGQIILQVPAVGIVAVSISTVFDGHLRLNLETDR